ncbi:hypothetical protein PHYPSEUDO_006678 [Phytophthora pseudosyringae]|uniref:Histone RNA hairpin-binding protein RNA-binding domain-containing protein n=1 Tax=Phytophthora pseudosyringae TaxID=221518 RepID=A0A8T1VL21_9STRA|nr:hypothetical protein PHYPSEUDO_006678 [Phytophthora pseudosyringae]
MKRGAEAMNGGDSAQGDRNSKGNRGWQRPNHKRLRHEDRDRSRNGSSNANSTAGVDAKDPPKVKTLADEKETDPHRLAQRQKQIDYGKNTIGYDLYCAQVPRHQRQPSKHPMTPDKTMRIGKKVFDGIVRKWRQALHKYDPPELAEAIKTVNVESSVAAAAAASSLGSADVKMQEGAAAATSCSAFTATSTEPGVKKEERASTPPSRSIYENFDEDNFDEDNDSDDDLL